MALLDYPQNFLDEKGNPKPGVFGPSPASMGLLSAGLGILASPEYTSRPQGLEPLGQAGLQGLQAYQNRLNQIQQQRQAYNQSLMQAQNQEMAKQRFQAEVDERKRLATQRERRVSQLPMLLEQIRNLGTPGIEQQVMGIQAMGDAGNIDGAYQAATNILGQRMPQKAELEYKEFGDNVIVIDKNTGKFVTQFNKANTSAASSSSDNLTTGRMRSALFKADQNNEMDPLVYRQYYRTLQSDDAVKGTTTTAQGGTTLSQFSPALPGLPTPYEYALRNGIEDPEKIGISKEATLSSSLPGGGQKPLSATQSQEGRKLSQIGQAEEELDRLVEGGFDPTKMNLQSVLGYYTGALKKSPFAGDERSFEQVAEMGGAAIGYLFSGANVPREEMSRFRFVYYPIPGDSPADVARKKRARMSLINYSNQMLPEQFRIKVKSLREDINNASDEEIQKPDKILDKTEEITSNFSEISGNDAMTAAAEVAAELNLPPKEKPKREVKRNNAGRVYEVSVLPGDGASKILQAAGIKFSEDNIKALIRANKKRFDKNRQLINSGGFLIIPKAIRQ